MTRSKFNGTTEFFMYATQFLWILHNYYGIYPMGMAKQQWQNGSGMVETRH